MVISCWKKQIQRNPLVSLSSSWELGPIVSYFGYKEADQSLLLKRLEFFRCTATRGEPNKLRMWIRDCWWNWRKCQTYSQDVLTVSVDRIQHFISRWLCEKWTSSCTMGILLPPLLIRPWRTPSISSGGLGRYRPFVADFGGEEGEVLLCERKSTCTMLECNHKLHFSRNERNVHLTFFF